METNKKDWKLWLQVALTILADMLSLRNKAYTYQHKENKQPLLAKKS